MYTTLRARLLPDGTVEFENTVSVSRPVDVLVTILEAPHSATADTVTSELPLLEADTVEPDPDATELRPPLAADARYRKIRPLGAGGMGEAWLAQDRETGQRVCLKQLQARMDTALLLQEFRAMARLEHPGFVRLLDLDLTGFAPVLVMEYIDGLTLRQIMGSRPLLETPAIAIARALFEAVTASHARNILHCDLKPENIIVILDETGRPQPRIIDLGLAVVDHSDAHGNITAATRIAGTPSYMAPEQLRGEAGDARTDVYALAVTGFELLTGEYPYTQAQVLAGVEGTRKLLPPEVPPGLEAALRAGLCLDAAARPGSMDAFLARLEGAGSAEETPGDGASAIEAAPNASPTPPDSPPSPPPEGAVDAAQLRALGELYTVALHPAKNLLAEVAREADPEVAARWLQTEGPRADLERHRARTLDAAPLPAALAPGRDAAAAALGAFLDGGSVVAAWEAWRDLTAAAADLLDAHRLRPGAEALEPLLERPPARTLTLERGAWADRSLRAPDPGGARDGLRSLVADLLRNAEFAGATRVHLDLAREGPGLRLDLRDDGPGAGREDPAATRVQQGRSASSPGMGTGLASARRWLEARGGGLEAGDHPEGGFFVTVRLPAVLEL